MGRELVHQPGQQKKIVIELLICLLFVQVDWLRTAKTNPDTLDDTLLEGHLNLTKELFAHVPAQVKYQYGAHPDHKDSGLIKVRIYNYLDPDFYHWLQSKAQGTFHTKSHLELNKL